jgi:hypothetical protein
MTAIETTTAHKKPDKKHRRVLPKTITREYIHSLRGIFKGKGLLKALEAERAREREREERKFRRFKKRPRP